MPPIENDLDLKFFARIGKSVTFKKGDTVLRPGENPTGIYYIKKGLVRLYSISTSGQEITFNIFKPHTYLFMMWALSEIDNNYFFEALTEVETIKASKEKVVEFIRSKPDLLYRLNKRTMIALESIIDTTQTLLFGKADAKISATFVMLAKRFGKNEKNNKIIINAPLTHRLIATLAGLTRETVSLEIEKLEKAKIISKRQHFFVINKMKILESRLEVDPPKSSGWL